MIRALDGGFSFTLLSSLGQHHGFRAVSLPIRRVFLVELLCQLLGLSSSPEAANANAD